ncbi:MAG: PilZ domain-containing protein [Planctomycetota bacterium]|nr:PilZ domain-containing protein [Planctomycetota bacterium]
MDSRFFPRKILPGCRADCYLPRRLSGPLPLAANRPIRNLSISGLSLIGLDRLPLRTVIEMQITGPRPVPTFQLRGIIRWVDQKANRRGLKLTLTGVEFCPMDPETGKQLEALLDWKHSEAPADRRYLVSSSSTRRMSVF